MRTIAVVTVGRSDYGLLRPVIRALTAHPALELHLLVGGMHFADERGRTIEEIERDGVPIGETVEIPLPSDEPLGIAEAMAEGTAAFARAYARRRPDLLLVLGDRYETHAAVTAALPFAIPVAHIHGGESTEGLIDEAIRHSITKMSHLHFVATEPYARRIRQMGEEPWRVAVSGAPGLDAVRVLEPLDARELEKRIGLRPGPRTLLVTYHPVTLDYERTEEQFGTVLAALDATGLDVVFTAPNADTRGRSVAVMIAEFAQGRGNVRVASSLGSQAYLSLLGRVGVMVGNSSSGIIEAASFRLPVVNIGPRQQGRLRPRNVIDCGYGVEEIRAAIERARRPAFRAGLADLENPYGDGHAAERIVETLAQVPLDRSLVVKRFVDLAAEA